jgi:hypothetical protein
MEMNAVEAELVCGNLVGIASWHKVDLNEKKEMMFRFDLKQYKFCYLKDLDGSIIGVCLNPMYIMKQELSSIQIPSDTPMVHSNPLNRSHPDLFHTIL